MANWSVHALVAQGPVHCRNTSVDNSSADEGAGEDEDGPDDFDEEDGDRFRDDMKDNVSDHDDME